MITDVEVYDNIYNTKLLSDDTKRIYLKKLNTIKNDFFTKEPTINWIINNHKKFKQALLNFGERHPKLSKSYLSDYSIPIISTIIAFRKIQEHDPTILNTWRDLKNEIYSNNNVLNNQPNEKQESANISFKDIEKIRDELEDGSDEKLLLSLYTYIPPLRGGDFKKVRIYKTEPKNDEGNYIVLNKNVLILNDYKTDKHYGTNKIELNDKLMKQIKISLDKKPRQYLFIKKDGNLYDGNSWNVVAIRILKKLIHPNFTFNMLRHIYISQKELNINEKTLKERGEIARKMGHSVNTQLKYYWK